MSVRVSVQQLQDELPELLEQAVRSGQAYIVQQDGEDYAVIVSARHWQQRTERDALAAAATAADEEEDRSREVGQRLDMLGPEYRLSPGEQERMEALLARREARALSAAEQLDLETLMARCDEIMLRRAHALPRIL